MAQCGQKRTRWRGLIFTVFLRTSFMDDPNGDTLVPANPDPPGKWLLNGERESILSPTNTKQACAVHSFICHMLSPITVGVINTLIFQIVQIWSSCCSIVKMLNFQSTKLALLQAGTPMSY